MCQHNQELLCLRINASSFLEHNAIVTFDVSSLLLEALIIGITNTQGS